MLEQLKKTVSSSKIYNETENCHFKNSKTRNNSVLEYMSMSNYFTRNCQTILDCARAVQSFLTSTYKNIQYII